MVKHFAIFLSPGSFFTESTSRPVEAWDVNQALAVMPKGHMRPFPFYFSTRERSPDDLDSRETKTSAVYYLGGTIETFAEVEARNDPKERTLLSNMRGNGWDRVIKTPFGNRQPLHDADVVLPDPNATSDRQEPRR